MKKLISFCTLLILDIYPVFAQNLIPNPSFEEYKQLPCDLNEFFIQDLLKNWNQPIVTSTDYWNTKSESTCYLNPLSLNVMPRSGSGMIGIVTYEFVNPGGEYNYREYVQTKLNQKLKAGSLYLGEFFTAGNAVENLSSNGLGMYFADTLTFYTLDELFPEPLPFNPQIAEKEIIKPQQGWVKVSDCFIANKPFEYIIIGNFYSDAQTSIVGDFEKFSYSYYYIDDVSVIELPYNVSSLQSRLTYCHHQDELVLNAFVEGATGYQWENGSESSSLTVTDKIDGDYSVDIFFNECTYTHTFTVNYVPDIDLGADTVLCRGEQFLLAPDYSESSYHWYDGSIDSAKVITEPGDYWVSVPSFCAVRDTVRVGFIDCPGFVPNAFTPNGDGYNQKFRIPNIQGRGWTLAVFNRWGKQVYFSANYKNDWEGEGLSPGIYYYRLSQSELNKNVRGWVQLLK